MQSEHPLRTTYGWLAVIFSVLTAGIGLAGYLYYLHHEKAIKQRVWHELAAVADLKTSQIAQWRGGRAACARSILKNPYIAAEARQWFERPGDPARRQRLLAWLEGLKELYRFQSVVLLDEQGVERLSVAGGKPAAAQLKALAAGTLRAKGTVFTDLHRNGTPQGIHLAVTAPLLIRQGPGTGVVGVVVFWIDPREELYPLIQSWPTPSPTAETLLVRREGDEVVYLNELRHRRNAAFVLRFPVGSAGLPAAMAVSGREGMVQGSDYRQVPVLAAVRHIPDSPWHLVAKMDLQEVYAPIRERAWLAVILTGLLIAASGLSVGLVWRARNLQFLRKQFELEREKQALVQHYAYLTKYANDIILLMDEEGRIVEANDRALACYGYTRDELLQLRIADLRSPESLSELETHRRRLEEQQELLFETVHQRKDGATFPVEVSARVVEVTGRKFYQSIVRDITERKRAEERVAHQARLLNEVNDAVLSTDENYRITSWNRAAEHLYGLSAEEAIGKETSQVIPNPKRGEARRTVAETGAWRGEVAWVREDGRELVTEHSASVIRSAEGKPAGTVVIVRDITERKQAEKMLRMTQFAVDRARDAVFWVGQDARLVYVNEAACLSLGYSREELLSMAVPDVDPDYPAEVWAQHWEELQRRRSYLFESRHRRKDGSLFPVEVAVSHLRFEDREYECAFARDITERKRSEAALRGSEAALRRSREELRTLAAGLLTAQEEERRRLSRELHDDLNQRLAMLAVEFESLEQHHPVLPEGIRAQLGSLKSRVVELSDDLRRMAYQLHPSILEHLGLAVALKSYCEEFSRREKIEAKLIHHNVPALLPQDTALCLYRVVQEGLRNVARHSSSPSVTVSLAGSRNRIRLSITDLGVGFDRLSVRGRRGLGLISMEERVRLVQGRFAVHSQPGQGARIDVRIPLPGKAATPPA